MKRILALVLAGVLAVTVLPRRAGAVNLELNAKSALLMDVATGTVLYEKDCHERLAPASVTKVMTLLLIMEAVDSGTIRLTDQVTASEAAAAKGGSQVYLKVGETMSVTDMLKSIAVSSANDCACAMAELLAGSESAFVEKMNRRAEELGMADTHFVNCTGLDDSPEAQNHRTSAYDIALMSRELLKNHPDIKQYTTIWMDTVRGGAFGLSNTNKLIRFYPGATGLKTGYTSGAGYCLSASAKREGMELIAVVMGCESSQKRTADCKALLDYGYAAYSVVRARLPEGRYHALPRSPASTRDLAVICYDALPVAVIEKEIRTAVGAGRSWWTKPSAPACQPRWSFSSWCPPRWQRARGWAPSRSIPTISSSSSSPWWLPPPWKS